MREGKIYQSSCGRRWHFEAHKICFVEQCTATFFLHTSVSQRGKLTCMPFSTDIVAEIDDDDIEREIFTMSLHNVFRPTVRHTCSSRQPMQEAYQGDGVLEVIEA